MCHEEINEILEKLRAITAQLAALEARIERSEWISGLRSLGDKTAIDIKVGGLVNTICNMKFVDAVYEIELANEADGVRRAMRSFDDQSFTSGERAHPSDPQVLLNGHYQTMLKRYLYAGKVFCSGKSVCDLCSGRGWGTFLLSLYANSVTAVDRDEVLVGECRNHWGDERMEWLCADVLELTSNDLGHFDVVTGMEIIEHFSEEDGRRLFDCVASLLRPGGVFIGTSFFPDNRVQADNHATLKRPDHLYLWTKGEIKEYFSPLFSELYIIDSWMIIAKKAVL